MTTVQTDNFKKIINQKSKKIQWGVTTPAQQSPATQHKNIEQAQNQSLEQKPDHPEKQKLSKKQYINTLNFQNLPIKESQIMGNYQQTSKTQYHTQHFYERRQQATGMQSEKVSASRLHQLKNQFEILKGMMIDSRIVQGGKSYDRVSNMSGSNVYSTKNHKPKMGQTVRGKERASKKSKFSSSSVSQKDINLRGSHHLKERSFGFGGQGQNILHKHRHKYTEIEKDEIRGSKISRSKHSHHYSQNPRTERQKISSRITQKPNILKTGGFLSNNLLQKQSLQLQLRSSLEKTQILIQNQILLKTKNHELQQTLRKYINTINTKDNSGSQKKIQQLQSKIYQYEQRLQNQKQSNRSFIERIGKLQADLFANQAMIDMLKQEKNKQSSNIMSMKLNFANLQIQNKRLQMERDIDNRESQFQIVRLKKQNQMLKSSGATYQRPVEDVRITSYEKDRIRFLQQQIQEKDRRYKGMLADIQNKKYLKDQAELMKLVETMHKKRLEQQGQGQIGRQLKRLKQQIVKIKNQTDLTQSQFGFESKVISLEQALRKDTQDKQKYLLQVQQFQRDYEDLKTKYKALQAQKAEKQSLILEQSRTQNKLKLDLQQAQGYRPRFEQAKRQNQDLSMRIQQLQLVIRNYEQIQHEVTQLRQALKKKQNDHNLEIKDARRRVDHAEFQSFKTQEESKFNLDINIRKLSSEIDLVNNQLRLMENDRNYHRDQLFGLRQQYEGLVLKVKDMQFNRDQRIKYQTQHEIQQKQRVKRQYQQQINQINQRFFTQEKRLVEQVGNLTRINQQMAQSIRRNLILESQNNQLRALCKQKISTESAIFHLWEIKQVQYNNINEIMRAIKPNSVALTARSDNIMRSNIRNNFMVPTQLGVFLPQMIPQQAPLQPQNFASPPPTQQQPQTQQQNYYSSNQNMGEPPTRNSNFSNQPMENQPMINQQFNQPPMNQQFNQPYMNQQFNQPHMNQQFSQPTNPPLSRSTQEPKISIPPILNLERRDSNNSLVIQRNEPIIFEEDRQMNFY